jgi:cation transport regulator ChaB
VPLDRNTVDRGAGRQIAELQMARHVTDAEKRRIREAHEAIARKVAQKAARR